MRWRRARPDEGLTRRTLTRLFVEQALQMASHLAPDLDLLACSSSNGMVRLVPPSAPPAGPAGGPDAAWQRLAATGELRPGAPTAEPADAQAPDELAATWLPSGAPVTLSGELAILVALRSRPGVVADVLVRTGDVVELRARWYVGAQPHVVLQETAGAGGFLDFRLLRLEQAVAGLLQACRSGASGKLDATPSGPRRPPPVAEAAAGWLAGTTVTAARANGPDVVVRTMQVGLGDGIWLVDGDADPAVAVPCDVPDLMRVAGLSEWPADTASWLHPDVARQS